MDRADAAYDGDFYAWTQDQAQALRRAGAERDNAPVDWETVAEEVKGSPSLRPFIDEVFAECYGNARLRAAVEAELPFDRIPAEPSFTLDQTLDPAYPAALFTAEWRS